MNLTLFEFFHSFAGRWTALDWVAVLLAKYFPYILAVFFVVFIFSVASDWRKRFWILSVAAASAVLARGIIVEAIKFFGEAHRPFMVLGFDPLIQASSFSFPSGHAAVLFVLAVSVWFFRKDWGYWFFAVSILISLARVFSGIHWPADIVAGAAIGIFSFWAVWQVFHAVIPGAEELTERINR